MKTKLSTIKLLAPKRILIVDDHPMTRQGVSQLLSREPDLAVCGEVENAQQAMVAVQSLKPDLVLTDITMPGKSGLEFLKDMQTLHAGVPVMVLSMHDETIYAERALRAGARGYLMKSESGDRLLEAVRQVLRGEVYVSKHISVSLLNVLTGNHSPVHDAILSALTQREFEVFQLIGQGLTTREIGRRIFISGKTVETHRIHIRDKLKLKTGPALTAFAVRWAAANQLI